METHSQTLGLIEYKDASPEVRAVYDDIMPRARPTGLTFLEAIAHDPRYAETHLGSIKQIMARARSIR